ncbi:MAG TPA: hypothetical protein VHN99_01860 [Deinococcales bacterium]|nr:hypothetical protein [Deinococcales bacterium]
MNPRLRLAGAAVFGALVLTVLPPARAADGPTGGLGAAEAATEAQASYRVTYTITDSAGQTNQIVLEVQKPDRKHEVIGKNTELIIIGPSLWLRTGTTWKQLPSQAAAAFAKGATPNTGVPAAAPAATGSGSDAGGKVQCSTNANGSVCGPASSPPETDSVTLTGTDTLNGKAVDVYHVTSTSDKRNTDSTVWVGRDDHLIYKIDARSTQDGDTSHTLAVYEYNPQGLDIEPPKAP